MPPKIAILGAGPAGLTIASLLHKNNVPFSIYDLRTAPSSDLLSLPSGSLDLHEESGLLALEACGLTSAYKMLPGVCTEEMLITGKDGILKYQNDGHGGTRPEVPRNDLLHLLLSSLPSSLVNWEHKLLSCTASDGKWTVTFQGRDPATFDLVIGADGAWSRVRSAVTDVHPHFSGISYIGMTIPHLPRYPDLNRLVGTGSFWALGSNKAIMTHRGSLNSVHFYLMVQSASTAYFEEKNLDPKDRQALGQQLLAKPEFFADWAPILKEMIRVACDDNHDPVCDVEMKPLYMFNSGQRWDHVQGVTLVGDAAHLMTPFAGEGVNLAMLDSLELANNIITTYKDKGGEGMDDAVKAYEEKMFSRTEKKMKKTLRNQKILFADDAVEAIVRMFNSFGQPAPPAN